jgi:uncharacterized protein
MGGSMTRVVKIFLKLYRYTLSPLLSSMGGGCRFHPSCSKYAEEAFEKHSFLRATWLTIRRLGKCGPWHSGGVDSVPQAPTH